MNFHKKLVWPVLTLGLLWVGCARENPGTWTKEKLEEHVKQSLIKEGMQMTQVTLEANDGGGFAGTGLVEGGETLKLLVTQDAAAHSLSWDAQGDRGSFLSGSYELK